jgi:RNA polymerase sigma factor (sigma-70 family)
MEEMHRMPANPFGLLLRQVRGLVSQPADSDAALLARFIAQRDEDAFTALVRRHGPLVLGLCRRWLGSLHDAEDVFQAAFLVLARKAASIRKRQSLASFLHGVALRLSARARMGAARRNRAPLEVKSVDTPDPLRHLTAGELRQALDEELDILPERYRAPLVLCYLQGRTQDEAARELGWSKGTLRRRLARGRELLQARLAGRGFSPDSFLAVPLLALDLLPSSLLNATVKGALDPQTASTAVTSLAEAGVKTVGPLRLRATFALLLTTSILAIAAGTMTDRATPPDPNPPAPVNHPRSETRPPQPWDDPLPKGAVARLGTKRGRAVSVLSLVFSPDGKTLLTSGGGGAIRVWDPESGKVLRQFSQPHIANMDNLCLASDGRTLAAYAQWLVPSRKPEVEGEVIAFRVELWDLAQGRITRSLAHSELPGQSALSPDGTTLASFEFPPGRTTGAVCLYDLAEKRPPRTLDTDIDRVLTPRLERFLQFSPDGRLVALGGRRDLHRFISDEKGKSECLGDGSFPPIGLPVQVWDRASGKAVWTLSGPEGQSTCFAFSPDSKTLATGSPDGSVRIWDLDNHRLRARHELGGPVTCVVHAPDGKALIAGTRGDDPAVVAWDVASGRELYRLQLDAYHLAISPDGTRLAVADDDNVLRLFDARTGRPLFSPPTHTSPVQTLTFSPDGTELASAERTGRVYRWDVATGQPKGTRKLSYSHMPRCLAYTSDGALVTGEHNQRLDRNGLVIPQAQYPPLVFTVLDLVAQMELHRFGVPKDHHCQISSDGSVVTLTPRETIGVVDGRIQAIPPGPPRFCDALTGQPVERPRPAVAGPGNVAVSPDSKWLAEGDGKGQILLRDKATGREVRRLAGHEGPVTVLAFAPNSRLLASGSADSTILLWDLNNLDSAAER